MYNNYCYCFFCFFPRDSVSFTLATDYASISSFRPSRAKISLPRHPYPRTHPRLGRPHCMYCSHFIGATSCLSHRSPSLPAPPLTATQSQLYSSCNPQGQDTSSNTLQVSALDSLYATTSRKTSGTDSRVTPSPQGLSRTVARAQVVAYRSELSLTGRRTAFRLYDTTF